MWSPCCSDGKESACNEGNLGLIPESGRFPGEGNGGPLQYSCLENPKKCSQRRIYTIKKPLNILEGKKLYTYISGKENMIMENI